MAEPSKKLLNELIRLKEKYGGEALNAVCTSISDLEPIIIIDGKDLEGCLHGSYESRWKHIENLAKSTKGKKVNATGEFKSGLYEAMMKSEDKLCEMTDCYLRLAQNLGIAYTSEELTRILFEGRHRLAATPYLVLKEIVNMGAEIDPKRLAEWAGFSLAESIAKENLLGDKTEAFKKYFVELNFARLKNEIKDSEKKIQDYRKKPWLSRVWNKHIRLEDTLKHLNTSLEISNEYKSKLLDVLFGYQSA